MATPQDFVHRLKSQNYIHVEIFHASCVQARPCLVFAFVFSSAQTAVRRSNERPENILDIKVSLVLRQRICFLGWLSTNRALTLSPPSPPRPLRFFFLDWGYLPFTSKTGNSGQKFKWFVWEAAEKMDCNLSRFGAIFLLFLVCSADLDSILWRVVLPPPQILQYYV